ncbi:hypothetical protein [Nonomuraea diastatica]|uniref:Shikimate kinase n=1 Tax=Nonomuraea diastatica TaxID=1848329 RepID=A0A4R4WS49_9ACTN|nr:hypothetical protein [Nonomuraea diastatica]TDD20200.1 hypothetical protein E1294_18660 [Nonomuraea diastatica]
MSPPRARQTMPKVLITGMSGTGKSSALRALAARGHRTVDTDTDEWNRWVRLPDGARDWVWREEAIGHLLTGHDEGALFVAGCRSNQGLFYPDSGSARSYGGWRSSSRPHRRRRARVGRSQYRPRPARRDRPL